LNSRRKGRKEPGNIQKSKKMTSEKKILHNFQAEKGKRRKIDKKKRPTKTSQPRQTAEGKVDLQKTSQTAVLL